MAVTVGWITESVREILQISGLTLQTYLVFCAAFFLGCCLLKRRRNLPPYPVGRVPVLGHLLALGRAPHLKLTAWRRQYGDVFTVRMGMKDVVVLNGYTAVIVNLYSLHMDPVYWPDPDRFDPGRFLDAEGNVINKPESFLPFSGGRRVCLGEQLARMELFLFFSTLLQSFTFRPPEDAPRPTTEGVFGITLRPHPFKLCAIPR
ncbi:cytochrome P450 2 sub U member 1 [Branchiostoma belcheri]|nr:cytochrome P450 2 sub U member 1 [Branchiostoma belcheri]